MAQFFQITANEVLSGISRAIYDVFGDTLSIYKDKQENLELPAVTIYCINYEKVMGRNDRYTNTFNIIINYFADDTFIINNRTEMFVNAEKIMNAIKYINLPAYTRDDQGNFVETALKSRGQDIRVEEQDEFMQISVTYTIRTKEHKDEVKMQTLEENITTK